MKFFIKSLLFSVLLLGSTTGFAQVIKDPLTPISGVDSDKKVSNIERVTVLLSGYEYFPSRLDFDKVGDEKIVLDILESFADDQTLRPSQRIRAIDALGFYKAKRTQVFLKKKIEGKINTKDSLVLQRTQRRIKAHAVTSYAKAFKKTGLTFLKNLAQKEDIDMKLSAIYGIGKHCGKEGRVVLQSLKKKEKNTAALRAIRKFRK